MIGLQTSIGARLIISASVIFAVGSLTAGSDSNASPRAWWTKPATTIDAFYNPGPIGPGKPGDLLRYETWGGYGPPYSVSATRILYRSLSAGGRDVAASGVVLLPEAGPPPGGWPVIAWAHPFVGVARGCAPSLMKGFYDRTFLSMYVNLGYAIVAPDYVGLGTDSRNASLDSRANAIDLIYSAKAAKAALSQLSDKWIAVGVHDGGLTALITNEEESSMADRGYLGSVAIDAILDIGLGIESSYEEGQDVFAFLAYGLKTLYPDFDMRHAPFSPSLAHQGDIQNVCIPAVQPIPTSRSREVNPRWKGDPTVMKFLTRNALGATRARAPSLILRTTDPPLKEGEVSAVARMCKQGDIVDLESYQVPADDLFGESVSSQITWIRARFEGSGSPSTCNR